MPYIEVLADANIRDKGNVLDTALEGVILTTTGNVWHEAELEGGGVGLVSGRLVKPYVGLLAQPPGPLVLPQEPPQLVIARKELGVKEVLGSGNNPRIVAYHQTCTLKATEDAVPWCSAFVNWCFTQAGIKGTNSAAAIHWLKWGTAVNLAEARPGDVVVFSRTGGNHVAFYLSHDDNCLRVLGGNQSDEVNIATYSRERLQGIRRAA